MPPPAAVAVARVSARYQCLACTFINDRPGACAVCHGSRLQLMVGRRALWGVRTILLNACRGRSFTALLICVRELS